MMILTNLGWGLGVGVTSTLGGPPSPFPHTDPKSLLASGSEEMSSIFKTGCRDRWFVSHVFYTVNGLKGLRPAYVENGKKYNFFPPLNRCKITFWRNIFLLNIFDGEIFQILILTHWLAQIMILVHWFWISGGFRTLPDQPNIRTWSATRFNFVENKQFPSIFEQCKFSLFSCYNQAVVL